MNKKIQMITLTRNGIQNLKNFNNSIDPETRKLFDWTIVDNESLEETSNYAKEISDTYTRNDKNLSFSESNNKASRLSDSEYILLANDDLIFMEQCKDPVSPLVNLLDSDPEIGCAGSLLMFPDYTIQHCGVVFMKNDRAIKNKIVDTPTHANYRVPIQRPSVQNYCKEYREYQSVTAAFMMVRRSIFEEILGFCEDYWYCFEDVDLCLKIRDLGKKIVYCPESQLIHNESSTRKINPEKAENELRMLLMFCDKWKGKTRRDVSSYMSNPRFGIYSRK